jgi:uncharacterized protein YodC (DUF2158 family)
MTFDRGDVVRLKSGGPAMTVVEGFHSIKTIWFNKGLPQSYEFAAELLDLVEKPKRPSVPTAAWAGNLELDQDAFLGKPHTRPLPPSPYPD